MKEVLEVMIKNLVDNADAVRKPLHLAMGV